MYPSQPQGGEAIRVILHRKDDYFECVRCQKQLKKDQNMKVSPSLSY